MKTLIALFLVCLVCACPAQYSSQIAEYRVYVYDTNDDTIAPTYTHKAGVDSFDISWERGTDLSGWEVPTTYTEVFMHVVPNTEGMWDGGSATTKLTVSLTQGNYAFTVTEVDINNWESGKATPFILRTLEMYAKVPFNYVIPESN